MFMFIFQTGSVKQFLISLLHPFLGWKRIPPLWRWSPSSLKHLNPLFKSRKTGGKQSLTFHFFHFFQFDSLVCVYTEKIHFSEEHFAANIRLMGAKWPSMSSIVRLFAVAENFEWPCSLERQPIESSSIRIYLEYVRLFAYWCVPGPIGIAQVAHKRSIERFGSG